MKVPATVEGMPGHPQHDRRGHSINVTLIFGLERYAEVIEAYLAGSRPTPGRGPRTCRDVASVASFFVSRVDTEVDRRLEDVAGGAGPATGILALRGKAAVAQAQLAYQLFREAFAGPRWEALAARGPGSSGRCGPRPRPRTRPTPTSLYVDTLIGPDTVNTMPDGTVDAFLDHGTVARTVDTDPRRRPGRCSPRWPTAGIDMADVAATLEHEGVASFAKSFDELMQTLADKAAPLSGGASPGMSDRLPGGRPATTPGR